MLLIKVFNGLDEIEGMFYEHEENERELVFEGTEKLQLWDGTGWRDFEEYEYEQVFEKNRELVYSAYDFNVFKVEFKAEDEDEIREGYVFQSRYNGSLNRFYWSLEELAEAENVPYVIEE